MGLLFDEFERKRCVLYLTNPRVCCMSGGLSGRIGLEDFLASWRHNRGGKSGRGVGCEIEPLEGRRLLASTLLVPDVRISDLAPGDVDLSPPRFVAMGQWSYFLGKGQDNSSSLWKTNGTPAGTAIVQSVAAEAKELTALGGKLFFSADDGAHGRELWSSDGTPGGAALVKDIVPGAGGSMPQYLVANGNHLYFSASTTSLPDSELWMSDGTEAGTVLLRQFGIGQQQWPINQTGMRDLIDSGGRLFFVASDGQKGPDLWTSDGTPAGTLDLKIDQSPLGSSIPNWMAALNGQLYVEAYGYRLGGRYFLWRSDGTIDGTVPLIPEYMTGAASPEHLTAVGDDIVFVGFDNAWKSWLWRIDGASGQAIPLTQGDPVQISWTDRLAALGPNAVFAAWDATNGAGGGYGLYRSGLGPDDARLLAHFQLNTSRENGNTVHHLVSAGDRVLFTADDGIHGNELWMTDGTAGGTVLLADLAAGAASSDPSDLVVVGNKVLLSAAGTDGQRGVWVVDLPSPTHVSVTSSTPAAAL
jgi:ELWxxDGT repeat protein